MNYNSTLQKWLFQKSPYPLRNALTTLYGLKLRRQRLGATFHYWVDSLARTQHLSREELEALQFEKIKMLVSYAQAHCRYWRDLFHEHGLTPATIHSAAELRKLPVLSKAALRDRMDDIVSDEVSTMDVVWTHTSGTTGLGLRFPETADCFQREFAFRVAQIAWAGVGLDDRWAYCAGHPVAAVEATRPPFWALDRANHCLFMSSYHLSEKFLPAYIEELRRYRPVLIAGYPSSVYLLALANQALGRPVQARAVLTSSETLFQHQREAIEASFGCHAFSFYGNAERAASIFECEKGGLHLQTEHSYVELLDENDQPVPPGREGRMVCTPFGNLAMPLIRYEVGDVAAFSAKEVCECGREGVLLDRLVGRTEDYIVTPDGRLLGRLDHLFKDSTRVRMAQLVQNDPAEVIIRIVREPGYGEHDEREVLAEARRRMGQEIRIVFEYVDDIPRTQSGKFRFIVSTVKDKHLFTQSLALD